MSKQQQIVLIKEAISKKDQEILLFQNQLREAEQILVSNSNLFPSY